MEGQHRLVCRDNVTVVQERIENPLPWLLRTPGHFHGKIHPGLTRYAARIRAELDAIGDQALQVWSATLGVAYNDTADFQRAPQKT